MKDDNEKFYKVIQQEKVDLNNNELNPIGFKYNLNENKNENKIENKINKEEEDEEEEEEQDIENINRNIFN